jgi:hypothetical protein
VHGFTASPCSAKMAIPKCFLPDSQLGAFFLLIGTMGGLPLGTETYSEGLWGLPAKGHGKCSRRTPSEAAVSSGWRYGRGWSIGSASCTAFSGRKLPTRLVMGMGGFWQGPSYDFLDLRAHAPGLTPTPQRSDVTDPLALVRDAAVHVQRAAQFLGSAVGPCARQSQHIPTGSSNCWMMAHYDSGQWGRFTNNCLVASPNVYILLATSTPEHGTAARLCPGGSRTQKRDCSCSSCSCVSHLIFGSELRPPEQV